MRSLLAGSVSMLSHVSSICCGAAMMDDDGDSAGPDLSPEQCLREGVEHHLLSFCVNSAIGAIALVVQRSLFMRAVHTSVLINMFHKSICTRHHPLRS